MEVAPYIVEVGRRCGYDFIPQEAAETFLEIMVVKLHNQNKAVLFGI